MSNVQGPADQPLFDPPAVRGSHKIWTAASSAVTGGEVLWSHGGPTNQAATETGEPWPAIGNITLNKLYLTLAAPSNVALSVGTTRNGVLLRTDVIPAGSLVVPFALSIAFLTDQTLQPVLLAAPTSTGVSLGIIYRYSPSA